MGLVARLAAAAAIVLLAMPSAAQDVPGTLKPEAAGHESSAPVAGPAKTDDAVSLSPIVVEADRAAEPALVERSFDTPDDVTGFGETIFAEPSWRSFQTTAELLSESVGAQIRRQGGRDDFSTLSIRGAPSAQVRILLDGVALGRASDSVVNLADLPIDTIDRIEVYRGFAPVGLTPVSAAGVVNVVTKDPDEATGSVAVGGGSFGTAKVNASAAAPLGGGSASAFASYRHTEGDFDYVDDNGTPKPADDRVRKRANNEADTVENLLRWRMPVGEDAQVGLRNHVFYKDEGVPGLASFSPPSARLETIREIAAVSVSGLDGRWQAQQIVTWQSKKLSDYDAFDNTAETTASTTAAQWGRPLGQSHWVAGSAEYTWEGFEQDNEAPSLPDQEADRSSLAVAIGDDWTIPVLDTTLSMQVRHQHIWNDSNAAGAGSNSDHSTDPRLGLRWEPLSGLLGLAVKSNVSSYFRPPSFDELYGTDGFTTGNPDLRPEEGLAWDAGLEWKGGRDRWGRVALGYSYFGSNIDDVIIVALTFARTAQARNESRARIRGHELRLEWQGPAGLAVSANYTHQDAENRDNGRELPGIAPDEGWVRLSLARGSWVIAYDLGVTGSHYTDIDNVLPKLPTRTVHGVSAVFGPFWKGVRLTFEADNLGNSLVPDDIGVPLPGRSFFGIVSWSPAPETSDAD